MTTPITLNIQPTGNVAVIEAKRSNQSCLEVLTHLNKASFVRFENKNVVDITKEVHKLSSDMVTLFESNRNWLDVIIDFFKHCFTTTEYNKVLKLNSEIQNKNYAGRFDQIKQLKYIDKQDPIIREQVKESTSLPEKLELAAKLSGSNERHGAINLVVDQALVQKDEAILDRAVAISSFVTNEEGARHNAKIAEYYLSKGEAQKAKDAILYISSFSFPHIKDPLLVKLYEATQEEIYLYQLSDTTLKNRLLKQ
jgi:hypothetical protein